MPTYEYECTSCHKIFERFQSIAAQPIKHCEECGSEVKRLIGRGAGILFKGSGFYQTDYRSSTYREAAKADTAPPSKAASEKTGPAPAKSSATKPSDCQTA